MKSKIRAIRKCGYSTDVILQNGTKLKLRPFIYLKKNDTLDFVPSFKNYQIIEKVFLDKATGEKRRIKIYPPYCAKETVYLDPHVFKVTFRERLNSKDWNRVKYLERFHYRGKGLDKIVGRRTVLLAEIEKYGIIGFGVLSGTVAAAKPRFDLLKTNFTKQMKTKLINRIARIPRIVIHPELRGMNLGVLMARHLIQYAKTYWDINHYTPIMVEVIAAMVEYHKFFEKAGFINIGYTSGYKRSIKPTYGNGSFEARKNHKFYDFMENQKSKPYLIFPLEHKLRTKVRYFKEKRSRKILSKLPKQKKTVKFENVSVRYMTRNSSTKRTKIIKEVFGVNIEDAFSTIITDFSLDIEPGDVVLITGASGSGKSTIIRLLTSKITALRKEMRIKGRLLNRYLQMFAILNTENRVQRPLIDRVKKNLDIKEAIKLLNSTGLSEAHLYIKTTKQISDGQHYRFAVAKLCDSKKPVWVADEFASTLNPEMSAIVAKGLRKLAYKYGATLVLAAPHVQSFIDSLVPNKLVKLRWGLKPTIFSLKIIDFVEEENRYRVTIFNNSLHPLTNVQIGLVTMKGDFKQKRSYKRLDPGQSKNVFIKVDKGEFCALKIRSNQGVGELFYRC